MNILITIGQLKKLKCRALVPCECLHCGATFYIGKNVALRVLNGNGKTKGKYCSVICRKESKLPQFIEVNCLNCHTPFKKNKADPKKFCDQSCAATHNNKKSKVVKMCLYCGNVCKRKYCNCTCLAAHRRSLFISRWKAGLEKGYTGKTLNLSPTIRNYLIEKAGNKCTSCGWSKVNIATGKVPLEINHKDGDASNNKELNLEVICANCHSLTPNFRALNKNSKRVRK